MAPKKGFRHSEATKEKLRLAALRQLQNGMPEETKEKIRRANTGRRMKEHVKELVRQRQMGNKVWLGRKHSEATKRRLSELRKGENGSAWKGGVTPANKQAHHSMEFRLWREAVFTRDDWTCQKCQARGGKLHPHHIRNFAEAIELRFVVSNGITLCVPCHKKFHVTYGVKRNNQQQVEEFIGRKLPILAA